VARDAHGVPLISGGSRLDVAYATGFVHAQERYFQMDLLRRVAAGELSELFGERALSVDKSHRLHRFRARAALALKELRADRALLERHAAGVNAGLAQLRSRPFEYALVGMAPRAWSADDSLLVIWAMYFDLQGGQEARELGARLAGRECQPGPARASSRRKPRTGMRRWTTFHLSPARPPSRYAASLVGQSSRRTYPDRSESGQHTRPVRQQSGERRFS
jgi:hypothetical protein